MKILLAEDDITSRKILEAILAKWGYGVVTAGNGDEAWNIYQAEDPPPMAIVDWIMPGVDGLEFCRRVRRCPPVQATYIILLTGKRQKEDVVTGLEAGADDYIRKPFDRDELRARVRVGERMVQMQAAMAKMSKELDAVNSRLKEFEEKFGTQTSWSS